MTCQCGRPGKHFDKTMCHACYERNRRLALLPRRASTEERFFALVQSEGECWAWRGAVDQGGYGVFRSGRQTVRAHRWAYEFLRCGIPDGLHLDHLCRNRACINPWHLEPVTVTENLRRGVAARLGDHCTKGHSYAETAIVYNGKRQCRTCRLEAYRLRNTPERRRAHAAYERARKIRTKTAA